MKMQGHTILVAGGRRGIGRGLAELLCRLGNEVLVLGSEPGATHAHPGMRAVELNLDDPWSVAGFSEQVAASCPGLNLLVNIDIAFPLRHLPGLDGLLEDDGRDPLEAHRLGIRHLTGALLPHLRKRAHGAIFNVSLGPTLGQPAARPTIDIGMQASAVTVSRRRVRAAVEVVDVAPPSHAVPPQGVARVEFMSGVARLLAEGLHETAVLERLRALWPAVPTHGAADQPATAPVPAMAG